MKTSANFNIKTIIQVSLTLDNKPPFYKIFDLIKFYKTTYKLKSLVKCAVRGLELKHRTLKLLGRELSYEETIEDYQKIPDFIFGESCREQETVN